MGHRLLNEVASHVGFLPAAVLKAALLVSLVVMPSQLTADPPEQVYYRYTNEDGVRVLEDRIPPRYVSGGYEVVSINGRVIRTVPPAPSEEEALRRQDEQRAQEERESYNRELRRRYSTVRDIRDAKRRNLAELQGNISMLESNLSNVRLQIRDLESRAAARERSGREVSDSIIENLATLQAEIIEIQAQIGQREQEYEQVEAKFDQDIEHFKEMQAQREQQ